MRVPVHMAAMDLGRCAYGYRAQPAWYAVTCTKQPCAGAPIAAGPGTVI